MKARLLFVICVASLSPSSAHAQGDEPPRPITRKHVLKLIEELGAKRWEVRERAVKQLWQAGRAAEPDLVAASRGKNAEVKTRALAILERFRHGLYPDTPVDVAQLIRSYRKVSRGKRYVIARQLLALGEKAQLWVTKLAAAEVAAKRRSPLADIIASRLREQTNRALIGGKNRALARALQTRAEIWPQKGGLALASDLRQRGLLKERIATLDKRVKQLAGAYPTLTLVRRLGYFRMVQGDLAIARRAAKRAGDTELLKAVLFKQRDWTALADLPPKDQSLKALARHAFYLRLAGRHKRYQQSLGRIRAEGKGWQLTRLLLLHGQIEAAILVLRKNSQSQYSYLLAIQLALLDYRTALPLARAMYKKLGKRGPWAELARALWRTGNRKESRQVLLTHLRTQLAEKAPRSVYGANVLESDGMTRRDVLRLAAEALGSKPTVAQMRAMADSMHHPHGEVAALFCRVLWEGRKKAATPLSVLTRLQALIDGTVPAGHLVPLIAQVEPLIEKIPGYGRDISFVAVGEFCRKRGQFKLAERCLRRAEGYHAWLGRGDLLAAQGLWSRAASAYKNCWKQEDRADSLSTFLMGRALIQSKQGAEGRRLQALAHRLPLADAYSRFLFYSSLEKLGYARSAARELRMMSMLSMPLSGFGNNWGMVLAHQASQLPGGPRELRRALRWEHRLISCAMPNVLFQPADTLIVTEKIHRVRALGLLKLGKAAEALREARKAQAILPGGLKLPAELVPELVRRGRSKEADALFRVAFEAHHDVCRQYPRSVYHHVRAARLALTCLRRVKEGLEHARQAVTLEPGNAAHKKLREQLKRLLK